MFSSSMTTEVDSSKSARSDSLDHLEIFEPEVRASFHDIVILRFCIVGRIALRNTALSSSRQPRWGHFVLCRFPEFHSSKTFVRKNVNCKSCHFLFCFPLFIHFHTELSSTSVVWSQGKVLYRITCSKVWTYLFVFFLIILKDVFVARETFEMLQQFKFRLKG